jgi:hypothetical protein
VNSCTISSNSALGGYSDVIGHGGFGFGGGICQDPLPVPPPFLANTIVADNNSASGDAGVNSGSGIDVYCGNSLSLGFNLIGNKVDSTGWLASDATGSPGATIEPLLGPLQINGGQTPTMMLLPNSGAIDAGNSGGLSTDQRGLPRPVRFPSYPIPPGGDGSDIGAVEVQPPLMGMGIGQSPAGLSRIWVSWLNEAGWEWSLLQTSDSTMASGSWVANNSPVTSLNGTNAVLIESPVDKMFFRLLLKRP